MATTSNSTKTWQCQIQVTTQQEKVWYNRWVQQNRIKYVGHTIGNSVIKNNQLFHSTFILSNMIKTKEI